MAPKGPGGGQSGGSAQALPSILDEAESGLPRPSQRSSSGHSFEGQIAHARAFRFRMVAAWWRVLTSKEHQGQPLRQLFQRLGSDGLTTSDAAMADDLGLEAA